MRDYKPYADVIFERVGDSFQITAMHPELQLHGIGRSAAVFRLKERDRVIKVFFPGYEQIAIEEAAIYEKLKGLPYFYISGKGSF